MTSHAKASLNAEEARNLKLHFVESSLFRVGRMSTLSELYRVAVVAKRFNKIVVRLNSEFVE